MDPFSILEEIWPLDLSWLGEPFVAVTYGTCLWLTQCVWLARNGNLKVKDLKCFLDASLGVVVTWATLPCVVWHMLNALFLCLEVPMDVWSWGWSLWFLLCLYVMVITFPKAVAELKDTVITTKWPPKVYRVPGTLKGKIFIRNDFDAPVIGA